MNITSFLRRMSDEPSVRPFARVEKTIAAHHQGSVYFQATYWPAKHISPDLTERLLPGTIVKVLGREGLTLMVAPVAYKASLSAQDEVNLFSELSDTVGSCIDVVQSSTKKLRQETATDLTALEKAVEGL